ncbi:MAG: nucleoside hydrolase [Draconibacterium sp.]|nr:nucleoside hydrolase [Draconibacterium sp.]
MKFILQLFILIFILNSNVLQAQPKIILDTDIGGDADDLGALAMLHNFVKSGNCELLAIMNWGTDKYAVPAIDAINRFYLNPDIPIGTRKDGTSTSDLQYNKIIADNFEHTLTYNDVPDATELYRKILASNEDNSIVIVAVGPLLNIQRLIQSEPDSYSPLTGAELISLKVKEFVIMGGKFPKGGWEWNFNGNMPGVTKFVIENLDVPIVFSGFELGEQIQTGAIFNDIDKETPLYKGFLYFSEHAPWIKANFEGEILDNSSFDQTAVLYAVKGGVGEYWRKISGGVCKVDDNGDNHWKKGKKTNHSYLKLKESPERMAEIIEAIMLNRFE